MLLRADAATNVKGRKIKINDEEFLLSLQRKIPRSKCLIYIYRYTRASRDFISAERIQRTKNFKKSFEGSSKTKMTVSFKGHNATLTLRYRIIFPIN